MGAGALLLGLTWASPRVPSSGDPEEPGRYLAIATGIVGAGTWGGGQHSLWPRDEVGQNELPLLSVCPEAPRSWPPYSSCLSAPPASPLLPALP